MIHNVIQNLCECHALVIHPLFSGSLGVQAKQVTMYKYAKFSKFNNKGKR